MHSAEEKKEEKNYVLFSAIGDNDPVRGGSDGPMLHIVRRYRPKKVYLFLTAAMSERDKKTNCYENAIHFLDKSCDVKKIHTSIVEAHDFDAFYEPFDQCIKQISEENPEAIILLNATSGTPQIKATMCLESVSHNKPLILVQVENPERKSGRDIKHFDENSSLETLKVEVQEAFDSYSDVKDRCSEPKLLAFNRNIIKNQVKALISNFDYQAAYRLISKNKTLFNNNVEKYLEHAYYRSKPDDTKARSIASSMGVAQELYPNSATEMYEYYLNMKIKSQRGEISDFLLRLKPFTEYLAEKFLKDNGVGLETFAWRNTNRNEWFIKEELENKNHSGLIEFLGRAYGSSFNLKRSINNLSAMIYIMRFKELNDEIIRIFQFIHNFKEKRDEIAHSLESVTEDDLRGMGTTSTELCETLEKLIKKIYNNVKVIDIYKIINGRIEEEMDS